MLTADAQAAPVRVRLFRDHDPALASVPDLEIGSADATGDPSAVAARWFGDGVRRVVAADTVDLANDRDDAVVAANVRCLALIRELTGHGIAVDWRLRLPGQRPDEWQRYGHLSPPCAVESASGTEARTPLAAWRERFRLGTFHYRKGPGFIAFHDFRWGERRSTVIDDPARLAAVISLERGGNPSEDDRAFLPEFEAADIVVPIGDRLFWLPCRLRRWPLWLNHFAR